MMTAARKWISALMKTSNTKYIVIIIFIIFPAQSSVKLKLRKLVGYYTDLITASYAFNYAFCR